MKVAIIGPVYPYRGGIAHYTTSMATQLKLSGYEVEVISFIRQYPQWLYPGTSDKDNSKEPLQVNAKFLIDPIYPWTWTKAVREINNFNPDLIIFQWWTTFWALSFAFIKYFLKRKNHKIVFLIHNILPHEVKSWDKILTKLSISGADQYIVQSENEYIKFKSVFPSCSPLIFNHPVYDIFYNGNITQLEAQMKLNLPSSDNTKYLLFFGIVRPYKGLMFLIEAFKFLENDFPNLRLLIAGEFWQSINKYKKKLQDLDLEKKVHIFDYYIPNEEIPYLFKASDIFVAPYINGTQSGAMKIALGYGLPIVGTEFVIDNSIRDANNFWVAEPGNSKSLANEIANALNFGEKKIYSNGNEWNKLANILEEIHKK